MDEVRIEDGSQSVPRQRHGRRLFVTLTEEPRDRRLTDVVVVIAGTAAAVVISLVGVPPSGADRRAGGWLTVPTTLHVLRDVVVGVFVAWALGLLAMSAIRRRLGLLRDLALAAVVVVVLVLLGTVLAHGGWVDGIFTGRTSFWAPPLVLALPAAVVFTASPHLTRPVRRVGQWLLLLSAAGLASGGRLPSTVVSAWLLALVAAAAVHVAFGSSRGRPSLADVQVALERIGVKATPVGAADRQSQGVFVVNAADPAGNPLLVKIYGRDAKDSRLVAGLWRRVWFRDSQAPVWFGRQEQVAHEAFLTLFVERAGVMTHTAVAAGSTPQKDALLVLRRRGILIRDRPEAWTEDTAQAVWVILARLREIGVAHSQVDNAHLLVEEGPPPIVGIDDLRGGTLSQSDEDLQRDEAQALVCTALALGPERAVAVAHRAIGSERLAAALPYLQAPALTPQQRSDIQARKFDLDALRSAAAEIAEVEVPALQQMRRVTWRSGLQLVLMLGAVFILANQVAGLDFAALGKELRNATWWLVAVGAIVAQAPRLAQAVSCMGASPRPLPLRPVYFLQLAQAYIGLVVPASAARIAINVRFFQRQGLTAGSALAVGAIDGFAGFIVEAILLVGILVLTPTTLHLNLSPPSGGGLLKMLLILVGVAAVVGIVLLLIPRRRRQIIVWVRGLLADGFQAVRGLQSIRRLALLLGGNLASDLFFATSLGTFAWAFDTRVPFMDLIVIIISVSLLSGLLPIPGGIGVVEGGLALGLVSAGMPEEAAFAAVILYRLSTYYVPPLWGFFALRSLERNRLL